MRKYFDHAASSPLRPAAQEAMTQAWQLIGNPAALHASGRQARARLEDAREELAGLLGARPDEVIFTSGGSEADSIAVLGAIRARPQQRVLISAIEHPAVSTVREICPELTTVLPVASDGTVELTADHADQETALVSVQAVNNEIGTIQPLTQVVEFARGLGAWSHSDFVQGLGHLEFDFTASGLDLASISAHKIGGPVGIGALLKRRELNLPPTALGGGQESGLRSGTQLVALAAGFATAAAEASRERAELTRRLELFRAEITASVHDCDVRINGGGSPHILNLGIPGASGEDVLFLLDAAGFDASTGSACRAGVHGPSEVLLALGQDEVAASSAIRLSMGWSTTPEQVRALSRALPGIVEQARSVPR